MRRETNKSVTKMTSLRDELGTEIITAWTKEHSDLVIPKQ